jgi:hypothetical protein
MSVVEEFTIELDPHAEDEFAWEDAVEGLEDIFADSPHNYFRIDGKNMGWTRRSGYTIAKSEDILKALSIDGDYRLVFTFSDVLTATTVKVARYSHDEPMGAFFEIAKATDEEVEEYL